MLGCGPIDGGTWSSLNSNKINIAILVETSSNNYLIWTKNTQYIKSGLEMPKNTEWQKQIKKNKKKIKK